MTWVVGVCPVSAWPMLLVGHVPRGWGAGRGAYVRVEVGVDRPERVSTFGVDS